MKDRPGVIAPPPLIFAVAFFAGWLARHWLPRIGSKPAGVVLAIAALGFALAAAAQMIRAGTHIDPYEPATKLVTSGPFRLSRNPLYLSLTLLYCGVALFFALPAAIVALPAALAILHFGVIRREERYLESKFGDPYREYRKRVRRWI